VETKLLSLTIAFGPTDRFVLSEKTSFVQLSASVFTISLRMTLSPTLIRTSPEGKEPLTLLRTTEATPIASSARAAALTPTTAVNK